MSKQITHEQAVSLDAMIHRHGSIEAASHDCHITLVSLGGYRDRRTEALKAILDWLATRANRDALVAKLHTMAQEPR